MTRDEDRPQITNAAAGIVITAEVFNPSVFSETWLIQNGIIPPDAFSGLRIFSSEVTQFAAIDTQVTVLPLRMQINFPINNSKDDFKFQINIASKTISLLPQTPYRALGINFDFLVTQPQDQDFKEYNHRLLGEGSYSLISEFSSNNPKFGRYFSKDYGDARLKLDIRPVKAGPDNKDSLQFAFNFHHEVFMLEQAARVDKLLSYINSWSSLYQYVLRLVEIGC